MYRIDFKPYQYKLLILNIGFHAYVCYQHDEGISAYLISQGYYENHIKNQNTLKIYMMMI